MAYISSNGRHAEETFKTAMNLHKDILEHLGRLNELLRSNRKVAEELAVARLVEPISVEWAQEMIEELEMNSLTFPDKAYMWIYEACDGTINVRSLHGRLWNISGICNWCWDRFDRTDLVDVCGEHWYCFGCVRKGFEAASRDRSVDVPSCCGETLWTDFVENEVLDSDFLFDFKRKRWEWSRENEKAPGEFESDEAELEIAAIAKAEKWKRCFRCWRWVERLNGCGHMKCICGAEFCYYCGEPNVTCRQKCAERYDNQSDAESQSDEDDQPDEDDQNWENRSNLSQHNDSDRQNTDRAPLNRIDFDIEYMALYAPSSGGTW